MIPLRLRISASFKNRLVRTFGQAGSTGDTFIGNQQRHNPRLLLTTIKRTRLTSSSCHDHYAWRDVNAILVRRSFPSQQNGTCSEGLGPLYLWAFGLRG